MTCRVGCRAQGAVTAWQLSLHQIDRFIERHAEVRDIMLPALLQHHRDTAGNEYARQAPCTCRVYDSCAAAAFCCVQLAMQARC